VCDIYKITYVVDDFVARMTAACEHALRLALIVGWQHSQLDMPLVIDSFQEKISATADKLGVSLSDLNVTNVSPNAIILVAGAIDKLGQPAVAALEQLGITAQSMNGSKP
jgi:hypothetical protein